MPNTGFGLGSGVGSPLQSNETTTTSVILRMPKTYKETPFVVSKTHYGATTKAWKKAANCHANTSATVWTNGWFQKRQQAYVKAWQGNSQGNGIEGKGVLKTGMSIKACTRDIYVSNRDGTWNEKETMHSART